MSNLEMLEEFEVHPCAALFPMMNEAELQELADDIKLNGLLDPIYYGSIPGSKHSVLIDGRNRMAACKLAGVDPEFAYFQGDDVEAYIISKNVHRRHLDTGQGAMIAVDIANMKIGDNQHSEGSANLHSLQESADKLDVSRRSAATAKKIQEEGTPELTEAVRESKVSLNLASKIAKLPEEEQKVLLQKDKDEIKAEFKPEPVEKLPEAIYFTDLELNMIKMFVHQSVEDPRGRENKETCRSIRDKIMNYFAG